GEALADLWALGEEWNVGHVAELPVARQRGGAVGPAGTGGHRQLWIAEADPATAVARNRVRLGEAADEDRALEHFRPAKDLHAGAVFVGHTSADVGKIGDDGDLAVCRYQHVEEGFKLGRCISEGRWGAADGEIEGAYIGCLVERRAQHRWSHLEAILWRCIETVQSETQRLRLPLRDIEARRREDHPRNLSSLPWGQVLAQMHRKAAEELVEA